MASVATGEATRDGGGVVYFFYLLEVKAAALASVPNLFLEDAPSWVFTIQRLTERETKEKKGTSILRGKDEKSEIKLGLECF